MGITRSAFAGIILAFLVTMLSTLLYGVWVFGVIVALGATVGLRDYDEQSLGSRLVRRTAWWRARRKRANVYRSGPLGRTHWGRYQLPGLLAGSRLSEHMDSYGRPFALVHVPSRGHWTVVMAGDPNGDALVDEDRIHRQVASWGDYLREMGFEPAIEQVTVTLESVPATRAKLRREVQSRMDADASEFAREMLAQTVAGAHDSSPDLNAYVALTVKGSVGGRRRAAEEVGEDVASRLPMLTAGLERAGMTDVRPMSAQQVCELVRVSYDPAAATVIDRAHAEGKVPSLSWGDVGPSAAEEHWQSYRHDSAMSVTWAMTRAPEGMVDSAVLQPMISAHRLSPRKRVTLMFRLSAP